MVVEGGDRFGCLAKDGGDDGEGGKMAIEEGW
jgi:hypothetical protein